MNNKSKSSTLNSSLRFRSNRLYPSTKLSAGNLSTGTDEYLNERNRVALTQPDVVKEFLCPVLPTLKDSIIQFREQLSNEIHNPVPTTRFIVTGPRELSDHTQASACSRWLLSKSKLSRYNDEFTCNGKLPDKLKKLFNPDAPLENLKIAMSLNINGEIQPNKEPYMTQLVSHGVMNSRILLMNLADQIPIVGDIGDPISSQYFNDLFSLGLVSSQNIESQIHRELASGVPFPVGFNSSTSHSTFSKHLLDHKLQKATDALLASSDPHYFLSVSNLGNVTITSTSGNKDNFLIVHIQYNSMLLEFESLLSIINQILLSLNSPKIVLDVGTVSRANFKKISHLIDQCLRSQEISDLLIGFIIDSGERYVPDGFSDDALALQLTDGECDSLNEHDLYSVMSEHIGIKPASTRTKILSSMKTSYIKICSTFENKDSNTVQYQDFIYADRLINEIDRLIKRVKTGK